MYPLGVVPEQPRKKLPVEGVDIHPEVVTMIVGEFFLHRAVEPFCMSVLLRSFGRV